MKKECKGHEGEGRTRRATKGDVSIHTTKQNSLKEKKVIFLL